MIMTLSSKGQIVLPKEVRNRLRLTSGSKIDCQIQGKNLVLIPQINSKGRSKIVKDSKSGLMITKAPEGQTRVTSEQVQAALVDFP
jgi:AbrB family looped-hinge helix DNA binding protein